MLPTTSFGRKRLRAAALSALMSGLALVMQPSLAADKAGKADPYFDGSEIDRQLAEQYAAPGAATNVPAAEVPALDTVTPVPGEPASLQLEREIDAVLAEADAQAGRDGRVTVPDEPWHPAWIVAAGVVLLASIALALTLALRELRKEAKQRRMTSRRRVRHRGHESAPISVN